MHARWVQVGGHLPMEENIGVPAGDLACPANVRPCPLSLDVRVVLFSNRTRPTVAARPRFHRPGCCPGCRAPIEVQGLRTKRNGNGNWKLETGNWSFLRLVKYRSLPSMPPACLRLRVLGTVAASTPHSSLILPDYVA